MFSTQHQPKKSLKTRGISLWYQLLSPTRPADWVESCWLVKKLIWLIESVNFTWTISAHNQVHCGCEINRSRCRKRQIKFPPSEKKIKKNRFTIWEKRQQRKSEYFRSHRPLRLCWWGKTLKFFLSHPPHPTNERLSSRKTLPLTIQKKQEGKAEQQQRECVESSEIFMWKLFPFSGSDVEKRISTCSKQSAIVQLMFVWTQQQQHKREKFIKLLLMTLWKWRRGASESDTIN